MAEATPTGVAVVGAGPFGLSIAAHLEKVGVDYAVFGKPMEFWLSRPQRTFLKSYGYATNVYTPGRDCDFVDYCRERDLEPYEPCAIPDFARYGVWAQRRAVSRLIPADVACVKRDGELFALDLVDGKTIRARNVVLATGLRHFARIPPVLEGFPSSLVSHTFDKTDFAELAGKVVCVVGGGQSALEAGALLDEAGARSQLLIRAKPNALFNQRLPRERPLWQRIRWPQSVLGPSLRTWILEAFPYSFYCLPERWRIVLLRNTLGPMGAWWLKDRVIGKVAISTGCEVVAAREHHDRMVLTVRDNGAEREIACDHVVAGTGYEVDVDRMTFLEPALRSAVRRSSRGPRLDSHFGSSVPGLFFVGPASSPRFGPLFRFAAGAEFTARVLTAELVRRCRASASMSEATNAQAAS